MKVDPVIDSLCSAPRLWGDKAVNERGEFRAVIRESKQAARMT